MTVQELIDELQKVQNKDAEVEYVDSYYGSSVQSLRLVGMHWKTPNSGYRTECDLKDATVIILE